jgi:hypothetical protein
MQFLELIIDYRGVKDNDLSPFTENVLQKVVNNSNFTITKDVFITPLATHLATYQVDLGRCLGGSKLDTLKKNQSKSIVCDYLEKLAIELSNQAKGDRDMLATTGFILIKQREKHKTPPPPTAFKAVAGTKSGEILLTVDANALTLMYYFFCKPAASTEQDVQKWNWVSSPKSKAAIDGLTRGTEYECTCAYQGPNGELIYGPRIFVIAI